MTAERRRPRRAPRRKGGVSRAPQVGKDRELEAVRERQDVLYAALGLSESARRGDRGTIGQLNDAVLKIQDYLIRSSERIDTILGTLKNHRELLVKMNQRQFQVGTRERIRMELDIMRNTLSILTLAGADVDEGLVAEIRGLRDSTAKAETDVAALRKSKERLDRRFDTEVRKFDGATPHPPKGRDVPGYG